MARQVAFQQWALCLTNQFAQFRLIGLKEKIIASWSFTCLRRIIQLIFVYDLGIIRFNLGLVLDESCSQPVIVNAINSWRGLFS